MRKVKLVIISVIVLLLLALGWTQFRSSQTAIIDREEAASVGDQFKSEPPAKGGPSLTPEQPNTSTTLVSSRIPAGTLDPSLQNEVNAAINRSLNWLAANQKPNGSWSNDSFPALTALALQGFIHSDHPKKAEVIAKATQFIMSCVQPDGGIYVKVEGRQGGGLSNYNTSICMTALHETGNKAFTRTVLNARKFVADSQHTGGDVYTGGFGYDASTDRKYADILNTFEAMEGMVRTAGAEDLRPASEERVDIDWPKSIEFVESIQNKEGSGPENKDGFFYKPGQSKAGSTTNEAGVVVFRSYGSMTYVGMLSLIYAQVPKDDPRVMSAFHWSAKNWSLTENPGMGEQGLYFFYNIISKCLTVFGRDEIPGPDGTLINWRAELAKKVVSLQKIDPKTGNGYWVNDTNRFWESDPILVTAYALAALEML
jgi:squalene-hopene/tetraprenyl-beta-curcumene cyclase